MMNVLIEKIVNGNTGRSYLLTEHTVDAIKLNTRGAKIRMRKYLKIMDKLFWEDEGIPYLSKNRLIKRLIEWKDESQDFKRDYSQRQSSGQRGRKSFSSPTIKYDWDNNQFSMILPSQIIEKCNSGQYTWKITSENFNHLENMDLVDCDEAVTGYKTPLKIIYIPVSVLFDSFFFEILDGALSVRKFRINGESIRFFTNNLEWIKKSNIQRGEIFSFSQESCRPISDAIIEQDLISEVWRTAFDFVEGDIIRFSNGNTISVGGKVNEGLMGRGLVNGASLFDQNVKSCVYRDSPHLILKVLPRRINGTLMIINKNRISLADENGLCEGIVEFELPEISEEKGYLIDLKKFGCIDDGVYDIYVDVPNDTTHRKWKFLLINNLEYEFEGAPYVFENFGTLAIKSEHRFEKNSNFIDSINSSGTKIDFTILPDEPLLILKYNGIQVGFDIPALFYKFEDELWQTDEHGEVWYADFPSKLYVRFVTDSITIHIDDNDDEFETWPKTYYKNKNRNMFECDLTQFKSWFDGNNEYRDIFIKYPGDTKEYPFIRVITKSVLKDITLWVDRDNKNCLKGSFNISGKAQYFADIKCNGELIAEKQEIEDGKISITYGEHLRSGNYNVSVFELKGNDFGFGGEYYLLGNKEMDLIFPEDLAGFAAEIVNLRDLQNGKALRLKYKYYVEILSKCSKDLIYSGNLQVFDSGGHDMGKIEIFVEFVDTDDLNKVFIFYKDEATNQNKELLYVTYYKDIRKKESTSVAPKYRHCVHLNKNVYEYEIMFIDRDTP